MKAQTLEQTITAFDAETAEFYFSNSPKILKEGALVMEPTIVGVEMDRRIVIPTGHEIDKLLSQRGADYPLYLDNTHQPGFFTNIPTDIEINPHAEDYRKLQLKSVKYIQNFLEVHGGAIPENEFKRFIRSFHDEILKSFLQSRSELGNKEGFVHYARTSQDPAHPYGRYTGLATSLPVELNDGKKERWTFEQAFMVFANETNGIVKPATTPIHGHPKLVGYSSTIVPLGEETINGVVKEDVFRVLTVGGREFQLGADKVPRNPDGTVNTNLLKLRQRQNGHNTPIVSGEVVGPIIETQTGDVGGLIRVHAVTPDLDLEKGTPLTGATYFGPSGQMGVFDAESVIN